MMFWAVVKFLLFGRGSVLVTTDCKGGRDIVSNQIVLLSGTGVIRLGTGIVVGWKNSPSFYLSYAYIEARNPMGSVTIGDECVFSNDLSIISESEGGIRIGKRCCVGSRFRLYDSDFHSVFADCRNDPRAVKTASVRIGDDVFIGENVMVLKGVEIGDRSVVAAGSVVVGKFPSDVVIAGNPARIVKHLKQNQIERNEGVK